MIHKQQPRRLRYKSEQFLTNITTRTLYHIIPAQGALGTASNAPWGVVFRSHVPVYRIYALALHFMSGLGHSKNKRHQYTNIPFLGDKISRRLHPR